MKNKISLFSAIVLLALSVPVSSATLDSIKAPLHVGEKHLVCGNVVQVTEQRNESFLILEGLTQMSICLFKFGGTIFRKLKVDSEI